MAGKGKKAPATLTWESARSTRAVAHALQRSPSTLRSEPQPIVLSTRVNLVSRRATTAERRPVETAKRTWQSEARLRRRASAVAAGQSAERGSKSRRT